MAELNGYVRLLRQAAVKKQSGVAAKMPPPQFSPAAQALLEAAGTDTARADQLEALAGELVTLQGAAPVVHLTLAAMPAEGLKKQMAAWLRQNLSPQVLVNFGYHTAILGGMVVRVGSRTFDWSFRRQILAAAPEFARGLKHV